MQNAACLLWIEARYYGGYSSYDVTWWTDGDVLFELKDFEYGDTLEIEREIVIMAPPYAIDNLVTSVYLQDNRGRLFRCAWHKFPVTIAGNPDEYVNVMAGALSIMTEGSDVGRSAYAITRSEDDIYTHGA